MTREEEIKEIMNTISVYYKVADCGIYPSHDYMDDDVSLLLEYNDGIALFICFDYAYFEVLGTTKDEFIDIEEYYYKLRDSYYDSCGFEEE